MSGAGIPFTAAQAEAIAHRAGNLAVSASAGSGKTAVLTERVFRLVVPEPGSAPQPVGLDELLVITFTEKAAGEMRERIERRLMAALKEDRDNALVARALDALPGAWIMTIDAFCRRLVVEHFHRAGVSPSPRVPDGAELSELTSQVLRQRLEDAEASDAAMLDDLLRESGGTRGLLELLRTLIDYLDSLDSPERWLERARGKLRAQAEAAAFADLPEAREALEPFRNTAADLAEAVSELIAPCAERGAAADVLERLAQAADALTSLAEGDEVLRVDALREALAAGVAGQVLDDLDRKRTCGPALYQNKAFLAAELAPLTSRFEVWRKNWLELSENQWLHGARLAGRRGLALLDLAETARDEIARMKQRRGWVSFNDFERLALGLLVGSDTPGAPSDIAHAQRLRFKHVLVDEYQDTSPLQHAIVRMVAREDEPGNLFLVGDVKQSIYRFRYAEPELFLRLLHPDRKGDGDENPGEADEPIFDHVRLAENFRSRPGILAFVNACFAALMDEPVGGVDYARDEQLAAGLTDEPGDDPVCVETHWLDVQGRIDGEQDSEGDADDGNAHDPAEDGESGIEEDDGLEGVEAQAARVARRLRELIDRGEARPGECAILLRSLRREMPLWVAALEREGLPVRSPGLDPTFTAPELVDLVCALRLADSPLQDVPLAAVMRSPLGGFTDDELTSLRIARPHGAFHRAVFSAAQRALPGEDEADPIPDDATPAEALRDKLSAFLARLDGWRETARREGPAEVLERILKETSYEAHLAGHPAAAARLNHVDYLRRMLREAADVGDGRNPLAAWLERVDRAESEAQALGELPDAPAQTGDAVNLMTIHAAKGLEFEVVVLARLERTFGGGATRALMLDRHAGMALKGVDTQRRRVYPTLALRALEERNRRRERAEELRLLYVAMTRARRRLVLVGQTASLERRRAHWERLRERSETGPLGALERLGARSPLELIAPLADRLASGGEAPWLASGAKIGAEMDGASGGDEANADAAKPEPPKAVVAALTASDPEEARMAWADAVSALERSAAAGGERIGAAPSLVPGFDPMERLTWLPVKASVTSLRREAADEAMDARREAARLMEAEMQPALVTRTDAVELRGPEWGAAETGPVAGGLAAAERGALIHAVLAGVALEDGGKMDALRATARRAAQALWPGRGWKDEAAWEALLSGGLERDLEGVAWYFGTELGQAMTARPGAVSRELPFTWRRMLHDFDPEAGAAHPGETMLVQGIVDAVIDRGAAATVIDYKTDRLTSKADLEAAVARHRGQIVAYSRALRAIWQIREVEAALVFLDARRVVNVDWR